MIIQNAKDAVNYLYSLERFGIKLGLKNMQYLMNVLGNPNKKFKSVHVAGTNGKGSTCAYLESIFRTSGYKVGLYTSPHLFKFNERIRINNIQISDNELFLLTKEIHDKIKNTNIKPTFFEFTTAICFLYFAKKNVDIAVIEVGLGGRLDATNVITPLISVITNIDIDHTEQLGKTKIKIAKEKAGIIKKDSIIVTAEEDKKIISFFKRTAKKQNSKLFCANEYLRIKIKKSTLNEQTFIINDITSKKNKEFFTKLLGTHQLNNARVAILTCLLLNEKGFKLNITKIKKGIRNATWEGRITIFSKKPLIIVDGAHNVNGITSLYNFVKNIKNKKVLIVGFAKDKEYKKMISIIAPLFEKIIVTKGHFKPQDTKIIAEHARKFCNFVTEEKNVETAVNLGKSYIDKKDCMLVTGSLYMISDALSALRKK